MPSPLRLTHVSLHRFKAAYALEGVPLRPFNVVIGRNGAGKSTLLEGLQWIDAAIRGTVNTACDRYNGVADLVNHRHAKGDRGFELHTRLESAEGAFADHHCNIREVFEDIATVGSERLRIGSSGSAPSEVLWTEEGEQDVRFTPQGKFDLSDRLALSRIDELVVDPGLPLTGSDIAGFWKNAVFLRLEPTDLAQGSTLRRPSLAPLLDERGAMLPALIEELDDDGRQDLVDMLHSVLPDFREVEVFRAGDSRSGNYALREDIIDRGAAGKKTFKIPSWMLSEGTRRMTAIFALLAHRPGPSLLCIEEVENGLDPISVRKVLGYLKEASLRGVQVIVTTHSPWLLDDVDVDDVLVVRRALGDTTYTRLADDPASQRSDPRVRPGGRYIDLLEF
ncbi:Predicted ATPase [Nannocystis exedens]|uniref:Predicted ATPase n=1 Tax=Nannocystis exedens TaxID=54 RepID=A0A1I2F9D4_9BACT|nr:ATP-binding protein [Nannocystis exedens]PCC73033.1 DNA recombination protein RecF [Nannocystis exedens]SFF01176.1 Predicted ATPase [Nannocystis exedens]